MIQGILKLKSHYRKGFLTWTSEKSSTISPAVSVPDHRKYIQNSESALHPVYQKDIEKEFSLRPPTVTEMLKSLEARELILRIPDEQDGRFKRIVFTEKAAAVKDALNKEIHETEELLLRGISEEELKEFIRITEKMLQNLECSERG